MHQIENDFLKVSVRSFGAELISIFNKKTNTEHLWQADKNFWGWHAPVLFPVVGRCVEDSIIIKGKKYNMEKHGFARKSEFELISQTNNSLLYSLKFSEATLALYPYKFEFQIGYRLEENELVNFYNVINLDNNELLFSLGGHPALAVPFYENETYEDYYIEFEKDNNLSRYFIDENGFFNNKKGVVLEDTNQLNLKSDMFKEDALIFKDLKSRRVSIRSRKHSKYVSVSFADFNYLGLWAKENASYVCVEPWLGCADTAEKKSDFSEKEGVVSLESKKTFSASFRIGIY